MAKGEFAVAKVEHVEDTKGNNGDKGKIANTNEVEFDNILKV